MMCHEPAPDMQYMSLHVLQLRRGYQHQGSVANGTCCCALAHEHPNTHRSGAAVTADASGAAALAALSSVGSWSPCSLSNAGACSSAASSAVALSALGAAASSTMSADSAVRASDGVKAACAGDRPAAVCCRAASALACSGRRCCCSCVAPVAPADAQQRHNSIVMCRYSLKYTVQPWHGMFVHNLCKSTPCFEHTRTTRNEPQRNQVK